MTVSVLDTDKPRVHTSNPISSPKPVATRSTEKTKHRRDLDQVRALMLEALQDLVEGPANAASQYQVATRGSLMRARLALASCKSFDCSQAYSIAAAAACELIHNASLVHDDLLDGDSLRRGQPTVWKRYGKGVALCAGDLLLCAAFALAANLENAQQSRLLTRHLAAMTGRVIIGQSVEIAPRAPDTRPGFRAYIDATRAKTVPLIQLPLMTGPLAVNAGESVQETIQRFAESVGLAYQIIDDLDDLAELASGTADEEKALHPFHAWHHHRGRENDSPQLRVSKATRHALASLQRARRQLGRLEGQLPTVLTPTLAPLLVKLERRAQAHRRLAEKNRPVINGD
jgi:geranylgeranyl diphosphate synthase type II